MMAQHEKLERISMQIVKTLSGAIDAKDTYTNGHSIRVAEYSKEIARRAGFSEEIQNDIYMMGLLHDVGKIGIPDGISGIDIPIEARIIAIADAYDTMSSRRSYRDLLPQAQIRAEVGKGKGTQFDPAFAEIMLSMIDEDTDYQMREK